MKAGEAKDGNDEQGNDADDDDGGKNRVVGQVIPVVQDVDKAQHEDGGHVDRERDEEHEEVAIVAPPDAVVDPGAVVVKDLYAVVADRAVRAAGRSVKLTCDTPLHSDGDSVDLDVAVQWSAEVIVPVLVGAGPGYHSRVHECGQRKVHDHEEGDGALDDGNEPEALGYVPLPTAERGK